MCVTEQLVILGATGDLTHRLLLPGLGLALTKDEARRVTVIGAAREQTADWNAVVRTAFASVGASGPAVEHVLATCRYVSADATDAGDLARLLHQLSGSTCLYFALPPQVTERACQALAAVSAPESLMLALEKPIGEDLAGARRLNDAVARVVPEDRVFRVDHFLGMPGVLNLLGFRFGNRIFEHVWNREHIARIDVVFEESLGVEGRGSFYDPTGAMRDMIQSHLLQAMAVVMMEPPSRFDEFELRSNTASILRATRLWRSSPQSVVLGRYTAGTVGDRELVSYVDEPDVEPSRRTETFAQVTLEVDTWRWNGVPVRLRTGKAIGAPRQELRVVFRAPPHRYDTFGCAAEGDALRIRFEEEQVRFDINVGDPTSATGLRRVTLDTGCTDPAMSAYANVLRWVLHKDPAFSVRADGSEQGWRIVEEVQRVVERDSVPVRDYPAGSRGPVDL